MKNSPQNISGIFKSSESRFVGELLLEDGPRKQSQARLVLLIALSIFICEALVMLVMSFLPTFSIWLNALLDATLLVILLSPVFYYGLFRTLIRHISKHRQAEEELKNHRDRLDQLVVERTAELTSANLKLKKEISDRKQAEEELKREMDLNAALSDLYKPLISPSAKIDDIASTVLDKAKRLTQSEHGFVSSIDPITGDAVGHTLSDMLEDQCQVSGGDKKIVFPLGADGRYHGIWGHSLNTLESFYTNSPQNHFAWAGLPRGHIPIERLLSVPVILGEAPVGQIVLANKRADYTEQDLEDIVRIAEFYALAIQRNRAEEALQIAKNELEQRVKERTAELQRANEKLMAEIEERIRFQGQLEQSKSSFQAIVDGISDPLIMLTPEMKVKMLNRAAAQYYGLSEYRDIIDSSCHQMLKESATPCEGCNVPAAISSGKSIVFERKGFMDPERIEHVFVNPANAKDDGGGDVLLRISDITEQRMFENQLIHSEKMASLGVLVSSVAHEINNPISFISFNIPILRDYIKEVLPVVDTYASEHPDMEICHMTYPEFRKDISRLLDNMEHGSGRISTFVSNLKEFSHFNDKIKKDWIDLNSVIEKVIPICRLQIKKNVASFITNIPQNLPRIWSDRNALEQILINLLVNAAQASEKKDFRVELNVEVHNSWRDHIMLEVKDNGSGMNEKTIQRIFDPFFTTNSSRGGTGLGLYVGHNLVQSLGGRIEVESKSGLGSAFRVILPDKERRGTERL